MQILRALLIEDEKPAAAKLERLIKQYDEAIQITGPIESIHDAVSTLQADKDAFDLLFLDIQLVDGKSFEIFNQIKIDVPIIFTTAYDEFAIEAFKHNSIDYILKPYNFDAIKTALDKFYRINSHKTQAKAETKIDLSLIEQLLNKSEKQYKKRFMARKGDKLKAVETENIKLFYADDRDVYLITMDNKRYAVNQKLEEIDGLVDPTRFFRVNRSFLVHFNGIKEVIAYSNSRLKLDVDFKYDKDIIVSREKVNIFKLWLEGEE